MATEGQIHFSTQHESKHVHTWTNIFWRRKWTECHSPFRSSLFFFLLSIALSGPRVSQSENYSAFSSWRIPHTTKPAANRVYAEKLAHTSLGILHCKLSPHTPYSLCFFSCFFFIPLTSVAYLEVLRGRVKASNSGPSTAKIFGSITLTRCWYDGPRWLCSRNVNACACVFVYTRRSFPLSSCCRSQAFI